MSSQFDDFNHQLKELISAVNDLKNENKRIKEENSILKSEMINLSRRVNKFEQKALECHMEIVGVPEISNEICTNTIQKITTKLGVNVSIQKVFRIPSKISEKPRKILVCLNSVDEKNKLMKMAKEQKLMAKDVDSAWNNSAIYLNDQMTFTHRSLFFKARTAAKQVGFKYIWFKNSMIFAKKNDSSKAIIIDDETSISKIV
jgi:hypothetical protein